MSQDFTDDCFASDHVVQTDMANIEKNFACLKSAFSGATAPSNLVAGMWWFDTTANILKLRNEANNAWQSVWDFANNKPVITNLSNEITGAMIATAIKDPAVGIAGLRTIGTGALQACAGNDARIGAISDATITQAKLKTSMGSVSVEGTSGHFTLPGGQYGFYPQVKGEHQNTPYTLDASFANGYTTTTSYVTNIYLNSPSATESGYAQQRYVTASGEVHWIFILRNRITKKIISMYQAPDHPCFGNGGKPLLVPHPFGSYDETKHEIIVINLSLKEIERMELETIVDDETKPDKDLLEVITENYEIDESSSPKWPSIPVTVGLPKHIKDKKTGKKILADYRFMGKNDIIKPIKKIIPKPDYIKVKTLKRMGHA